jgi:hypothetical protein
MSWQHSPTLREPLLPQALNTPQGIRFIIPELESPPLYAASPSTSSTAPSESPLWGWANTPLLVGSLALSFFTANLVSLVGPFLPDALAKLGQSHATVGFAFAVYPAFVMMGSPLAAVACARLGQVAPHRPSTLRLMVVRASPQAQFQLVSIKA